MPTLVDLVPSQTLGGRCAHGKPVAGDVAAVPLLTRGCCGSDTHCCVLTRLGHLPSRAGELRCCATGTAATPSPCRPAAELDFHRTASAQVIIPASSAPPPPSPLMLDSCKAYCAASTPVLARLKRCHRTPSPGARSERPHPFSGLVR